MERPELRIVSEELWDRVQQRQALMLKIYGHAGAGVHKASSSAYLLTGLLKCGSCGANLVIVAGKGRKTKRKYYGCSQHFNRGACENGLTIRQDVIERNFFAELQRTVLTDEVIAYTTAELSRRIRDLETHRSDEAAKMGARKREIEQQLARLAAAIADTGHNQFVVEAMTERQRELDRITHGLETVHQGRVEQHPGSLRELVSRRLSDLLGLLRMDTVRARAELVKHTGQIQMVPEKGADGRLQYVAVGGWDLTGGRLLWNGCGGWI
jgi:site-specific DNA recombinase